MESSSEDEFTSSQFSKRRAGGSVRSRATRKRSSEEKEVKVEVPAREMPEVSLAKGRKAPTPFAFTKAHKKIKNKKAFTLLSILIIGLGISAGIGLTDKGQIDVEQTIEARNERIKNNTQNESDTLISNVSVPVQDTNNQRKPDGGLKGRGTGGTAPAVVPEPETSSSTASSTDLATSTDNNTGTVEEETSVE